MLRRRKYFNGKRRASEFWWVFAILFVLIIFMLPIVLTNFFLGTFILIIFIIVSLLMLILFIINYNDIQKVYSVKPMSKKSLKRAKFIKKKFTDSVLAERFKIGIKTRYGVMIPSVSLWVSESLDTGTIFIENLGTFEKLDRSKLIESVSGILPSPYECVSTSLVLGAKFFRFEFEDTQTSHRFIVSNYNLKPFINNDVHSISLSDDLVWNARTTPHLSLVGHTGSGKSFVAGSYIAELMVLQGWTVVYASMKPDRYTHKFNGPTTAENITDTAEHLVEIMKKRLLKIQKMGADDYSKISGMNDISFFVDEIGHLNAVLDSDKKLKIRFENAMKALSFTGRSSGIHVIGVSQFATIEAFFPSSVRGNMKDAVIMLGGSANSGEERKFLIPGFTDIPNRNYKIGEGIVLMLNSGNKWSKPHYFETPLFRI